MTNRLEGDTPKIKHMFEYGLDVSDPTCYKSHMRSIEQTFERTPKGYLPLKGTDMALALPITAAGSTARPVRKHAPIRLTARGRVAVFFLLSVITLLLVMLAMGGTTADAANTSAGPATATVVVQPGETLWSIAKHLDPQGDPRAMVQRLAELNDMQGTTVAAGQQLIVPAGM